MPLKLKRIDGIWHASGTVAGDRLRFSTKTTDKTIAARVAAKAEQRAWDHRLDGPASVLTFAQAVILYQQAHPEARFLVAPLDYFKERLVRTIKAGTIRQGALDTYPAETHTAATRNRQFIVPTRAVIMHCAELGKCRPIRVKLFPVDSKVKRPVTQEWLEEFCAAGNQHIGALAMFMYATGARISEALAVQWDDVNLRNATALIRQTKLGNERLAHLPSPVVAVMAELGRTKGRGPFFYLSREAALHAWNGAIKKAGIEPLTFHCCRHGFATSMLQAGVDAVTVAKRGGWKSVALVLSTYGHAAERKDVTDVLFGKKLASAESEGGENPIKWGRS